MPDERVILNDVATSRVIRRPTPPDGLEPRGVYALRCRGPREEYRDQYNQIRRLITRLSRPWWRLLPITGSLISLARHVADGMLEEKWIRPIENLVTTEGRNFVLDNHFAGAGYTAGWYLGLISSVSFVATAAGDTAAEINGTNDWKEAGATFDPTYVGDRPELIFSTPANAASKVSDVLGIEFTSIGTVVGCFLCDDPTKEGNIGTLYSAAEYLGGSDTVKVGDFAEITYTAFA